MLSERENPPARHAPATWDVRAAAGRPDEGWGDGDREGQAGSCRSWPGTWWIAHTKSRQEKKLAWDLKRLGIGYLLPMFTQRRRVGNGWRRVRLPMFPGYVFAHGTGGDREAMLRTGRLCRVIDVADQRRLRRELAQIERLLDEPGLEADPRPPLGAWCRIAAGSKAGVVGRVTGHAGRWNPAADGVADPTEAEERVRVLVGVSMLGQSVSFDVPLPQLEIVDEAELARLDDVPCYAGVA